ncbi:MAG: DUF1801 domain-containing protein [Pyrinomonadaceae bacterium]
MANADLKTKINDANVEEFLNGITDEGRRSDSFRVVELMKKVTGEDPKMWGTAIIGLGRHHLKYASGRELDSVLVGFSPRKANLTLYITDGFDKYDEFMSKLGKYTTGKSCLYIKRLSDIDVDVLKDLVAASVENVKNGAMYPRHE